MFDLYFVGTQNKEHDEYMIKKNCSRLFSYAEKPFYTIKRYLEHPNKLFIDSGAFSIANKVTRGKNLTIDDYIEFINSNTRPDLYASSRIFFMKSMDGFVAGWISLFRFFLIIFLRPVSL